MHYFAGLFDADGYISLSSSGSFTIAMEKANEECINIFQSTFGGSIYKRTRKTTPTYAWRLNGGTEKAIEFIDSIAHLCYVKREVLLQLRSYLKQSREQRRESRKSYVHTIKALREYRIMTKEEMKIATYLTPSEEFFKWFAGFMDGDGNFSVFEYQNGQRRSFDSWIGAFNTCPWAIIHINSHIHGSISSYKGIKLPVWKWVCSQKESEFVCKSLLPYLIGKKEQCRLVLDYLEINQKRLIGLKRGQHAIPVSDKDSVVIRDIIKQIKHLNSR